MSSAAIASSPVAIDARAAHRPPARSPVDGNTIDTSKPYWWRRLTDVDPISLEPLRRMRHEPFGLRKDETHQCWFDGKVLAHYLVSTGDFTHPLSRRPLTLDDCAALDAYLTTHRAAKASVVYAFEHQEDYKKKESPENHVLRLQHEASELLRSLYRGEEPRLRAPPPPPPPPAEEESFVESVPLGGASLESPADFPALDGQPAPRPLLSSWARAPPPQLSSDPFPALSAAPSPAISATPPLVAAGRWASGPAAPSRAALPSASASRALSAACAARPPQISADDFPSLGTPVPPRASWAEPAAAVVARPPPQRHAPPPEPPRAAASFEAMAHEFPSLRVAAAPAAAAGLGKRAPPANREELLVRNKALMASLSQVAAELNKPTAMVDFKKCSLAFQKGELSSPAYLQTFRQTFGDTASRLYFSELLLLLPDEGKRVELQRCFDAFNRTTPAATTAPSSSTWVQKAAHPHRS
ncbi:hypothetical protein AB1Y20_007763 [Prymnesium parvum]|uniref:ZNF598/HEL2 PAH domain-containing protein n=1 Tax=Prymnesium parvum TaxID=97485 RepID=A0AB34IV73_PRYPA